MFTKPPVSEFDFPNLAPPSIFSPGSSTKMPMKEMSHQKPSASEVLAKKSTTMTEEDNKPGPFLPLFSAGFLRCQKRVHKVDPFGKVDSFKTYTLIIISWFCWASGLGGVTSLFQHALVFPPWVTATQRKHRHPQRWSVMIQHFFSGQMDLSVG